MNATGSGSAIQKSLAAVILSGLASSLILTLITLSAIYHLFERTSTRGPSAGM